jgi:hypothetical protein
LSSMKILIWFAIVSGVVLLTAGAIRINKDRGLQWIDVLSQFARSEPKI